MSPKIVSIDCELQHAPLLQSIRAHVGLSSCVYLIFIANLLLQTAVVVAVVGGGGEGSSEHFTGHSENSNNKNVILIIVCIRTTLQVEKIQLIKKRKERWSSLITEL